MKTTHALNSKPCVWLFFVLLVLPLVLSGIAMADDDGDRSTKSSPNGRYRAEPVGSFPSIHYQISDEASGEELFRTRFLDTDGNDLKRGAFSPDSKYFAAVYMYCGAMTRGLPKKGLASRADVKRGVPHGQEIGPVTWIGIWEIASGKRVMEKRLKGYISDDSMFTWPEWKVIPTKISLLITDDCPMDHRPLDPEVRFVWVPAGEEGTIPGGCVVIEFCSPACRERFEADTNAGVGLIKSMNHSEKQLTITNRNMTCPCPKCKKPVWREHFRINGDEITFFCSDGCLALTAE